MLRAQPYIDGLPGDYASHNTQADIEKNKAIIDDCKAPPSEEEKRPVESFLTCPLAESPSGTDGDPSGGVFTDCGSGCAANRRCKLQRDRLSDSLH